MKTPDKNQEENAPSEDILVIKNPLTKEAEGVDKDSVAARDNQEKELPNEPLNL